MTDNSARLPEVDFLRGISLLGILFVNTWLFSSSLIAFEEWSKHFTKLDSTLISVSGLFFEQRFVGIFSLLFGLGIAIKQKSFEKNISAFSSYFFKRSLFLAILGVVNILLFFWGDILLIYGLLSVLLFLFLKGSNKIILIASLLIFFVPVFLFFIPAVKQIFTLVENSLLNYYSPESLTKVYQSDNFSVIMIARVREYIAFNSTNLFWQRTSLAMMLLGYIIGRNNLHLNYQTHFIKLKPVFLAGLLYCTLFVVGYFTGIKEVLHPLFFFFLYNLFILISIPTYVYVFLLIYHIKFLHFIRTAFVNLGKMSLSNYFLQSVVCSFIFTGYGFAFYFHTSPSYNLLICGGVFVFQTVLSTLYLTTFDQGPLEWLLRKLTDSKKQ